jgi:hypothetical protein
VGGVPDRMTIQPMVLADIIDGAMHLYRRNFAPFLGIVAIAWVPALAVQVAGIYLLLGPLTGDEAVAMTPEAFIPAVIVFALAGIAVYLIAVPLAQGALIWAVSNRYLDRPAGLAEAYHAVIDRLGNMIAVIFLTVLVVLAGTLACIIPGIIFAFMFSFAIPEVVLENRSPMDAMKRSWQLANYDFRKVITTLLVLGLLVWLLTMVLAMPFSWALVALAGEQNMILAQTLARSVNTLVQVLIQPIQIIGTILLYYDLRIRHEGFDIELLADAVAGGKAAPVQQPPSLLGDDQPLLPPKINRGSEL